MSEIEFLALVLASFLLIVPAAWLYVRFSPELAHHRWWNTTTAGAVIMTIGAAVTAYILASQLTSPSASWYASSNTDQSPWSNLAYLFPLLGVGALLSAILRLRRARRDASNNSAC